MITGATGGLGQEFVSEVLKENIDEIWAVARNENKLNELKAKFGENTHVAIHMEPAETENPT